MNAKEWEIELLHRYNEANGDYQDCVCLTLDEAKEIMLLLKDLARMRVMIKHNEKEESK